MSLSSKLKYFEVIVFSWVNSIRLFSWLISYTMSIRSNDSHLRVTNVLKTVSLYSLTFITAFGGKSYTIDEAIMINAEAFVLSLLSTFSRLLEL